MPSIELDAGVDESSFGSKQEKKKEKKESKALPILLGVLALLVIYYFIASPSSSSSIELTAEEIETEEAVKNEINNYIEDNGSLPANPSELNLPPGSELSVTVDGQWAVVTADGQLIFSENALPPYDEAAGAPAPGTP